jgi:hypothetical protein
MGKVGSRTVYESLKRAGLSNPIFHIHFLSDDITEHRRSHLRAGSRNPYHLDLGEAIGSELKKATGKRCKLISLVRDPIAVRVSDLFQNPYFASGAIRSESGVIDPVRAADYLRRRLEDPDAFDYVFNWFDREVKSVFSIDVFAQPFPREVGYSVLNGDVADLLVLRLEDFNEVGPDAVRRFLQQDRLFEYVSANVRADTPQAVTYDLVKKNLKLEHALCEKVYSSKFVRHFYDTAQINGFIDAWARPVNPPH